MGNELLILPGRPPRLAGGLGQVEGQNSLWPMPKPQPEFHTLETKRKTTTEKSYGEKANLTKWLTPR